MPKMWSPSSIITTVAVALILFFSNVSAKRLPNINGRILERQEGTINKRQTYYTNGTNSTQAYRFLNNNTQRKKDIFWRSS